jgi:hypothetical protein
MAKKLNPKTEIKKLLDKTEVDEKLLSKVKDLLGKTDIDDKLVDAYQDAKESGLLDKIKCYIKCYGGYLVAVGAGCYFGKNFWVGLALLVIAGVWGYKSTHSYKICKK